jgi:hypothetical protein
MILTKRKLRKQKVLSFSISSVRITYLGIILTKRVRVQFSEKLKTLMEEIEGNIHK